MRVLIADPGAIDPSLYQRFVWQAQVHAFMADHLVEGEPYLAPNAVVLDRRESDLLRQLTATFARAFQHAGLALASDTALLEEWGFPWVAAELLGVEEPRVPIVGRFDFVRDAAGHWWLLEFNADTPSGIREAIAVDSLAHRMLPGMQGLQRPNRGLARALTSAFRAATRDLPRSPRLGLVTNAGELEDLAQMAFTEDLLQEPLAAAGVDVVLGDADNLRATASGLSLCGRPIGALYRYLPFEFMLGTEAFAAIADATAAGRVRVLNGLFGLLLQHKGVLAWLWSHRDDPHLDCAEQQAIRDHLPPTWLIGDCPPSVPIADLVAKQVFGREGEEVVFGDDATPEAWELLRRRRTYIVQQRVDVAEHDALVWSALGPRIIRGRATVGAYAVAGAWAGYYTRFGGKIITSRAKWMATFVE